MHLIFMIRFWVFNDGRAKKLRVVKQGGVWGCAPRSWGFFRVKKGQTGGKLCFVALFCYITLKRTLIMNWDDRINVSIKKIIIIIIINCVARAPACVGLGSVTPLLLCPNISSGVLQKLPRLFKMVEKNTLDSTVCTCAKYLFNFWGYRDTIIIFQFHLADLENR